MKTPALERDPFSMVVETFSNVCLLKHEVPEIFINTHSKSLDIIDFCDMGLMHKYEVKFTKKRIKTSPG